MKLAEFQTASSPQAEQFSMAKWKSQGHVRWGREERDPGNVQLVSQLALGQVQGGASLMAGLMTFLMAIARVPENPLLQSSHLEDYFFFLSNMFLLY